MTERTPQLHSDRSSVSISSDNIEAQSHHSHSNESAVTESLTKQTTVASGISVFEQRAQSVISRIRSREPGQTAKFTHPLSHTKTTEDVIVDFEGLDDPYQPLNWGFKKKAFTTVLYGLTTMGELCVTCGCMWIELTFFSIFDFRVYLGEFSVRYLSILFGLLLDWG
jgi:hypothetical protein